MNDKLNFIIDNYQNFYENQKNGEDKSLDKEMKEIIKYKLPNDIVNLMNLDKFSYMVEGSYGMGNYTETPWVSIFHRSITETAQKGFYIVIIFRKDMSGFYVSLNQGTTYLTKRFKGNPRDKMREVASKLREELDIPHNELTAIDIDLISKTTNAKNYEAANICAKYFSYKNMNDSKLITTLSILMDLLNNIKELVGRNSIDDFVDELLIKEEIDDLKYQEDILLSKAANTSESPQKRPNLKSYSRESWNRDSSIAKEAIINAKFLCEVDKTHHTFKSLLSKENYVEAHHLIPINKQKDFKYSVDVPGNIIALCPNCHRAIHYAEKTFRNKLLKSLYSQRKETLKKFGLDITLEELINYY
ncbi:DUF3578 domain-containing protein [Virgibacillus sp. M23]|uniref:MrcB family domain-containing protein n=1 Tax=Virgibacillus sp. M23 TaxID=3079030 RepID=UPI002A90E569|nr:DUF3578 domain-containing protein [Virgibacillus sp. M23]MDY7044413.1 DUF3578 domain-containing protein [Virgibacillus sp. M23]